MAKYINLEKVNKAFFDTRMYLISKIYDAYGEESGKILYEKWALDCGRSTSTIRGAIESLKIAGLVEVNGNQIQILKGIVKESQKSARTG